ncbi:MAG: YlxM family DNA-binding protein [Clostridiales bacterium]|nr:YlxM family DNA-binding protein [Clostridiales bacterium]HOC07913.1 YlxM family DNA-binding protein [Bacillota bacterium]HQA48167.1 YlxM family DNA-binding protein [Bacillota bacterium]
MNEEFVEMALLYDFYGGVLTPRQQEIMDLYYMKDYSLGEIGELLSTSRQAVFDNLKRAKVQLRDMEDRLGLVKRFRTDSEKKTKVLGNLDGIIKALEREQGKEKIIEKLREIREYIQTATGG